MSIFQFILIISSVVFLLFGIDLVKRKKATILHFLVFIGGGLVLLLFTFNNDLLNNFGSMFGIARGADLLVYIAIILLMYFYIELLNKSTKAKFSLTRLISQSAINTAFANHKDQIKNFKNSTDKDNYIFNIRVYNEGSVLAKTIDSIISNGYNKIIFINDGSKDNSLETIKQKQLQYPQKLFIVISHTINRGPGAANQSGYGFLKKYGQLLNIERVVGYDADGQMDINDMKKFTQLINQDKNKKNKPEMYVGSRFLKGSIVESMTFIRKIILKLSKIVTRALYGVKTSDPHIGYRVMQLNSLNKINLTSDGFHYANEFNEQMALHKIRFKEVPIHIIYNDYTLQKGQKNSNSIPLAIEMIYKKFFFR